MPHDLQKQWRERVVRAVNASFPVVKEAEIKVWEQCERLLPHVLACAAWTEKELPQTAGVAVLFHKAGIFLLRMADNLLQQAQDSEAEALLEQALSIYELHLG